MAEITIYTRPFCGFCAQALALLRSKGVAFREIEAGFDPELRAEMTRRSGRHTFPQIFVGDTHLGDCEEICELEEEGRLDAALRG